MDEWTQFDPFTDMPEDVDWKMRVFLRTPDNNDVRVVERYNDHLRHQTITMKFGASVDRVIDAPVFDEADIWYVTTEPDDAGEYIWRCHLVSSLNQSIKALLPPHPPSVQLFFRPCINDFVMK